MDKLENKIRPLTKLEEICEDSADVILNLFNESDTSISKVFEWKQDDYEGSAFVVYKYDKQYFHLTERFGSCPGCDDWLASSTHQRLLMIEIICDDIVDNMVDNLQEVDKAINWDFRHPELCNKWQLFYQTYTKSLNSDI